MCNKKQEEKRIAGKMFHNYILNPNFNMLAIITSSKKVNFDYDLEARKYKYQVWAIDKYPKNDQIKSKSITLCAARMIGVKYYQKGDHFFSFHNPEEIVRMLKNYGYFRYSILCSEKD